MGPDMREWPIVVAFGYQAPVRIYLKILVPSSARSLSTTSPRLPLLPGLIPNPGDGGSG